MEDRWGTPPNLEDRLSGLRQQGGIPVPDHLPEQKRRRTIKEVALGLALILVGCVIAVVVLGRSAPDTSIAVESIPPTSIPNPSEPSKGLALFAALLEPGSYPPAIREGDTVMVVVIPDPSSDSVTRALPDRATVTDVTEASTISGGVVVSMVGPEVMSRDVADAAEVHLSVVGGGK